MAIRRGTMTACLAQLLVLGLSHGVAASIADSGGSPSGDSRCHTLTCAVVDDDTGSPLAARCMVVDSFGHSVSPSPPSRYFYHSPSWAHGGYFYTSGSFSIDLPPGKTHLGVGHGFEYAAVEDSVFLSSDTTIVYRLPRIADMSSMGWHSGDCHVHTAHGGGSYSITPADVHFMGCAEDLEIVNCLDNGDFFIGGPDPASTPECIVWFSEEQRSCVYGHSDFLGLTTLVHPFYTTWTPLIPTIAHTAHTQPGTAVVSAHPITTDDFFDINSSPPATMLARTLPVDVLTGEVDGFEVLSFSNRHHRGRELDFWYQLLNCGFRLAACAGTDACVNRVPDPPLGGYRVYAQTAQSELDYGDWIAGLVDGRTFVTNGPLFVAFNLSGADPGGVLSFTDVDSVELEGFFDVRCAFPLERVEIVTNGQPAQVFSAVPDSAAYAISGAFTTTLRESSWVAARAFGTDASWYTMGDSLFAHTNPVYVELDHERVCVREDAESLVQWVSNLETLARTRGEWPSPADSALVLATFASARMFYEDLVWGTQVPPVESSGATMAPVVMLGCLPNPSTQGTTVRFQLSAACPLEGAVYDLSGRAVRHWPPAPISRGEHHLTWDGLDDEGRKAGSGVYFVRLWTAEGAATGKLVLVR